EPLPAERDGKPAAHREDDGVGNEVRREHPGALVIARGHAAGDVRKRHVGDAGVEHLHERGQRHDGGNQPGVVLGPPDGARGARGCGLGAHRGYTVGMTLMPGRSWRSRFSPDSSTILTGIRWTILT